MSRSIHRRRMVQLLGGSLVGAGAYAGLGLAARQERNAEERDCHGGKLWDMHHDLFGRWILLSPQKLGGGSHAVDLASNQTLAWISYWNYGDACPISHHLAAYPSQDPYKGFEFVNSTQGGENVLIYGIPTRIKEMGLLDRYGQGNHIYRVQYDGRQMTLVEDVAESTGIGLGVHTVIYPDAEGFACADGQKDIAAFFNRARGPEKTKVLMAFRGDWKPKDTSSLERCWTGGGALRFARLVEPKETGKYELEGTKGNKINWEMVPMGELLVERGQIPGDSPGTLTGLDAVIHHPNNRWSAVILRMCSAALIVDRKTWEPVTCLHMPKGSPDNLPVQKVGSGPDAWEVTFEDVKNPAHEAGFSPDGNTFVMMNNLRQNNIAVFDSSDPDPRRWKKVTFVEDREWAGQYPCPFHVCFSMDRSKLFVSVLAPKPRNSEVWAVDTRTWKVMKKFRDIGPDCQTMAVSYDGKYVFQIYSGFQRLSSGLFVFTQDTLEPVGFFPNFGGHHDCVVVPTKVEHLLNSRCTTL